MWRRVRLFRRRRMQFHSSSQVAHSPSRSRVSCNVSGCGSRKRSPRGQAAVPRRSVEVGAPASQILGEVAQHHVRRNSSVQIVSQPQLTPPFFHTWSRILLTDSLEKGFYSCFAAIPGCNCGWHTTRPRACRNYGRTWHSDRSKRELVEAASAVWCAGASCRQPPTLETATAARSREKVEDRTKGMR